MLPREFLSEIADKYGLSQGETDVLLQKFGSDNSNQEILDALHISDGTLRSCLGEVYGKFSIGGKGPGKAHRLGSFLTNEYQKGHASGFASSNQPLEDLNELVQKVQSLQVSPDNTRRVEQSLEYIPSVVREKQAIERQIQEEQTHKHEYLESEIRKEQEKILTLQKKMMLLAQDIKLTIQPIHQFFACEPVERHVFITICSRLKLEWQQILDIDFLKVLVEVVPQVRARCQGKIQAQCGTLRILDVAQRIELNDLYVDVNILDEPISYVRLELSDLPQVYDSQTDELDRFGLGKVRQPRVPGLLAVSNHCRLMVLGKPGAGKSTFLQHIAIQCNQGVFQADRIPIFIRLKTFAEDARDRADFSLLHYISQELNSCGIADQLITEKILTHGRALILLDGLDEVPEEQGEEVVKQIRRVCENYYKNQFIITCRIAAQQYRFSGFTDVEVADFNSEQIEDFAKKWFVAVAKNSEVEGKAKAAQFIQKLNRSKNQQLRELAVTPILLTLTCLVFQAKAKFPSNRAKLYEDGLEILLQKWDESRGIKRDEVYRNLSVECKIELLTQVAAITFERNRYFFEETEIQQAIADYLPTLSDTQTNLATLQRDSKAVLKSIEAQHGLLVERARRIYSFSHLTFQEYFTARAIVYSFNSQALEKPISRITNKSWREVFLLAVGMLGKADSLLLSRKDQINALIAGDEKLQDFLAWVNQKSIAIQITYKTSAIRAFYLATALNLSCAIDRSPAFHLDGSLDHTLSLDRALSLDCVLDNFLYHALNSTIAFDSSKKPQTLAFEHNRVRDLAVTVDPELRRVLQELNDQLPNPYGDTKKFRNWWQANSQAWTEQFRSVMISHRNIGHDWQFSEQQKELLKQYYDANKLLVDCLNSGCEMTPTVRQEIQDTLLLPMTYIEKRH